jgi:hypothetical protein
MLYKLKANRLKHVQQVSMNVTFSNQHTSSCSLSWLRCCCATQTILVTGMVCAFRKQARSMPPSSVNTRTEPFSRPTTTCCPVGDQFVAVMVVVVVPSSFLPIVSVFFHAMLRCILTAVRKGLMDANKSIVGDIAMYLLDDDL